MARARAIHVEAPSAGAAAGKAWVFDDAGNRYELRMAPATPAGVDTGTLALVPAGTVVTATGNGATTDAGGALGGVFQLNVTAASGTSPTLNVKIQVLAFDNTTWVDTAAVFTQATGVTSEFKPATFTGRKVRATWTVGGTTPSFTFGLTGEVRY